MNKESKSAVFKLCRFFLLVGYIFPDYLQVATAIVVPCEVGRKFSLHIYIGLILFSYSWPLGVADSCKK